MTSTKKVMKYKFYIIILLFLLVSTGCRKYKYEYYSNGAIKREVEYSNGIKNGMMREYHLNGNLKSIANWKNDKLSGESITYYEDGTTILSKCNWTEGKRDGTCNYYYSNGAIEIENNYVDGELSGVCKEYYSNGNLYCIVRFKNDLADGCFESYYENGWIKESGFYRKDILHGKYYEYSDKDSGKVILEEDYLNYMGEKTFTGGVVYDEDGNILEETMRAIVSLNSDTFYVDDEVHCLIELRKPIKGRSKLVLASYDDLFHVLDSNSYRIKEMVEHKTKIVQRAEHVGCNCIRGFIVNYQFLPDNKREEGRTYFEKCYYVSE
jgi:antitoxin component YwqK of YwqJK toxin-antitoxin module